MGRFGVSPEKEKQLMERMSRWGVREADLDEKFVRSSGAGGQNVNKVATCVWLKHRPSAVVVKCMRERSQAMNRYLARRILVDKIERQVLGKLSAEVERREKIRRQKRRRSRRAKDKMLDHKHRQSEKKELRGPVQPNHDSF